MALGFEEDELRGLNAEESVVVFVCYIFPPAMLLSAVLVAELLLNRRIVLDLFYFSLFIVYKILSIIQVGATNCGSRNFHISSIKHQI